MNRFTTHFFGLAVGIVLSGSASADVAPVPQSVVPEKIEGAKPRNVVFTLSDDHRYDAMSFMGHPFAKTPHMDGHSILPLAQGKTTPWRDDFLYVHYWEQNNLIHNPALLETKSLA